MAVASKFQVVKGNMGDETPSNTAKTNGTKKGGISWGAVLIGMGLGAGAYALIMRMAENGIEKKMQFQAMAQQLQAGPAPSTPALDEMPKVVINTQ